MRHEWCSSQVGFKLGSLSYWQFVFLQFQALKDIGWKSKSMLLQKNWYFFSTEDLDFDNTWQEISYLRTLQDKILSTLPFVYFQCLRFFSQIIGI